MRPQGEGLGDHRHWAAWAARNWADLVTIGVFRPDVSSWHEREVLTRAANVGRLR